MLSYLCALLSWACYEKRLGFTTRPLEALCRRPVAFPQVQICEVGMVLRISIISPSVSYQYCRLAVLCEGALDSSLGFGV